MPSHGDAQSVDRTPFSVFLSWYGQCRTPCACHIEKLIVDNFKIIWILKIYKERTRDKPIYFERQTCWSTLYCGPNLNPNHWTNSCTGMIQWLCYQVLPTIHSTNSNRHSTQSCIVRSSIEHAYRKIYIYSLSHIPFRFSGFRQWNIV